MGYNTKTSYDKDKDYANKSMDELVKIRNQFELAVNKYPDNKLFKEHLQYVKCKIGNRIGKKK